MRVEVLYVEGCPNHQPTVERVRSVISELGLDADVREVEVRGRQDAERLGFLGSPSVRVDGVDIDPSANKRTEFTCGCRVYQGSGVPPRELLLEAFREKMR